MSLFDTENLTCSPSLKQQDKDKVEHIMFSGLNYTSSKTISRVLLEEAKKKYVVSHTFSNRWQEHGKIVSEKFVWICL